MAADAPCPIPPPPVLSPAIEDKKFTMDWEQWFALLPEQICDSLLTVEKGGLIVPRVNDIVIGSNMTLTRNGSRKVTIAAQQGGHIIQDDGVDLPQQPRLNFIDPLVATNNVGTGATDVTSTGGTVSFGGSVWITMVAGGGGGATSASAASPGPGGGAGESVESFQLKVTPGAGYSYSVGAGGATDTDGGNTTFGPLTVLGGKKGATSGSSGAGGGVSGGAGVGFGSPGATGINGLPESASFFGGGSGGGRANGTGANGGPGAGSGGALTGGAGGVAGGTQGGGGGGAATTYGAGGVGGAGGAVGGNATATNYGAGAGGAGGKAGGAAGGTAAGGYLLITWLGGSAEYTSGSGTWTAPS